MNQNKFDYFEIINDDKMFLLPGQDSEVDKDIALTEKWLKAKKESSLIDGEHISFVLGNGNFSIIFKSVWRINVSSRDKLGSEILNEKFLSDDEKIKIELKVLKKAISFDDKEIEKIPMILGVEAKKIKKENKIYYYFNYENIFTEIIVTNTSDEKEEVFDEMISLIMIDINSNDEKN